MKNLQSLLSLVTALILVFGVSSSGVCESLFVNETGNVGVGTTSPEKPLHILGSDHVQLKLESPAGFNAGLHLNPGDSNAHAWSVNAANEGFHLFDVSVNLDRWVIDNSGNVGIGTTSPRGRIDVAGGNSIFGGPLEIMGNGNPDGDLDVGDGKLVVKNSGNVGIGTGSPTTRLEVRGGGKIVNPNGRTFMIERDNEDSWITFHDPNDVWYSMGIDLSDNRKFKLNNGGTVGQQNQFAMTTAGNVGIGTASPAARLDVNGSGRINGPLTVQGNSTLYGNVGVGKASPTAKLDVNGSGRISGNLTVKGNVYADHIYYTGGSGADYVFESDYVLLSLASIKAYIQEHHHLPEVPSAREMKEKGLDLATQTITHLKKIEELTLYMIALETENDELKALIGDLNKRLDVLESAKHGQLN